jgi:flagellar protein FlbD
MIEVTRLNGLPLVVNAELIKFVEATPDTLISLTTGEKVMVKEAVALVTERVFDYRIRCSQCRKPTEANDDLLRAP